MKQDKSQLRLGGRTLVGRIRATARQLGGRVRVLRRDTVPSCGPIGGVCTALRATRADRVLFLSCDMPFVSGELLRAVVGRLTAQVTAAFVWHGGLAGFPFALRRTALPVVETLLAERRFSLQHLAAALGARRVLVPRRRIAELVNINTPADWARVQDLWRATFPRAPV